MTLRQLSLPVLSESHVRRYVEQALDVLKQQGIKATLVSKDTAVRSLGPTPSAKVVLERSSASDNRTEVHYLVHDLRKQGWQLVYLLRRDNLAAWAPLLSAIDGDATR
jgi:hypothetical protein